MGRGAGPDGSGRCCVRTSELSPSCYYYRLGLIDRQVGTEGYFFRHLLSFVLISRTRLHILYARTLVSSRHMHAIAWHACCADWSLCVFFLPCVDIDVNVDEWRRC